MANHLSLSRHRAFTLIELLVVISIIALLIAILLPALKQARAVAQKAACASNERQVHLAWWLYMDDNAEEHVRARERLSGFDGYWTHKLLGADGNISVVTPGRHANYLGSAEVLECPTYSFNAKRYSWIFGSGAPVIDDGGREARNSYAYINFTLRGRGMTYDQHFVAYADPNDASKELIRRFYRQRVVKASDFPVFVDGFTSAISRLIGRTPGEGYDPDNDPDVNKSNWNYGARVWHQQTANVVFVDGHVGQLEQGSTDYDFNAIWGRKYPLYPAWK